MTTPVLSLQRLKLPLVYGLLMTAMLMTAMLMTAKLMAVPRGAAKQPWVWLRGRLSSRSTLQAWSQRELILEL